MSSSISFDRAAGFYDKTRRLPTEQADLLADAVATELSGRGRTLEIGVGTGRIALPLHARGVDLVGADISLPMLQQLVSNAAGQQPFPLLVADATRLPFTDGAYAAVIASHVFHLIPAWRDAADDVLRVLAPGGVLLADFGWHGGGSKLQDQVVEVMRSVGVERIRTGTIDPQEFGDYLGERATTRELLHVTIPSPTSLAHQLEIVEQQVMSWTWSFTPEQLHRATDAVRVWARENGVDVDEGYEEAYQLRWWAYDLVA